MPRDAAFTTGRPGLDRLLTGLLPGDNVVWQVDSVDSYARFVEALVNHAGRIPVHYFRFGGRSLLPPDASGVQTHELDPGASFEGFIESIHAVVEESGDQSYHVFDCLSGLAADWYSDTMLGNFFRLTCPLVYDVGSVAYFCVLRNTHSFRSLTPIKATAQIVIDVYETGDRTYVHPLKVAERHSPTMHLLHLQREGRFEPVTLSATVAEVLTAKPDTWREPAEDRIGAWHQTFQQAEELFQACRRGEGHDAEVEQVFQHLLRMTVARDGQMLALARKYFTWEDGVAIGKRLVGTGLIGGKSVGMLLSRAILRQASSAWDELLEVHDSFYVGSDVFYTFLVENGIWWVREQQRDPRTFLRDAEVARERILTGQFPEHIELQFGQVVDYFGQSPFIVRSSSLLEDNFGNAFAGKYQSIFCVNQGGRAERLAAFMDAVRCIYASTMSEGALRYRAQRGLLAHDEQMALLIQRVSGALHGRLFYPDAAGVGLSRNPYVWNRAIDPRAGLLRLVFGLGTRAVDRTDDDYTRIVALNVPEMRPEASIDEKRRYAQRKADVLDLDANELVSRPFRRLAQEGTNAPLDLVSSRDDALERHARGRGQQVPFSRYVTFEGLLQRTDFPSRMRELLATLEQAYAYPVDVEFTVNFLDAERYRINVVQCRPLQVMEGETVSALPARIPQERLVLESRGAVIGRSRRCDIDRLIYIVPQAYARLSTQERYALARLIGRVAHLRDGDLSLGLVGPGRWGTSTPSLGIPVNFAEIDTADFLCEVVAMDGDLVPDVSLGTHFFNDLIEAGILYAALFPDRRGYRINRHALEAMPHCLQELLPDAAGWGNVLRVIDTAAVRRGEPLILHADSLAQRLVCYWEARAADV